MVFTQEKTRRNLRMTTGSIGEALHYMLGKSVNEMRHNDSIFDEEI